MYSGTIPEFIDGDVFKTKISLNGTVNDTVNGTVNDGVKLTPTEQAVLDCIRENNLINVAEIVNRTKKGRSTIMRSIKALKKKDLFSASVRIKRAVGKFSDNGEKNKKFY